MKIFKGHGFLPPGGKEAEEGTGGLKPLAIVNKEALDCRGLGLLDG